MSKSRPKKNQYTQLRSFLKIKQLAGYSIYLKGVFVSSLLSLFCLIMTAQSELLETHLEQYTSLAEKFAAQNKPDSAARYYDQLAQLYYEEQELVDYIYSYIDAAFLYTTSGQYPQAIALLEKARQPLGIPLDFDEQWAYLWLYIHLAHNHHEVGDFLQAKNIYEKALLTYVGEDHRDLDVANYLYRPLGNIYTRLGEHAQAYNLLDRFRQINLEAQEYNTAAEALSDIGILYFDQRNFTEAIKSYQNALALTEINNKSRALVLSNLAGAYLEFQQYQKAIGASRGSIRLFNTLKSEVNLPEILAYKSGAQHKLAQAYLAQKNFTRARDHFEKALELSHKAYGTLQRRETAKIYLGLGHLNLDQQNPLDALNFFQKTLQSVLPEIKGDPSQNPTKKNLYAENSLMEALEGKALAYQQLYEADDSEYLLGQALSCYELIFEVEAKLRQNFQFESSKLFQVNESHQRSERALSLAYKLYKLHPDAQRFQRALQISEQARSVVLRESLQDSKAQNFAGIPDSLHVYVRELKINISLLRKAVLQQGISGDSTSGDLFLKKEKIFELEQAQQQLSSLLETKYPAYYRLKYQTNEPVSVAATQETLLAGNQVIVEYFVGEKFIYLFKVAKDQMELIEVANDFELQEQVELLLTAIRDFQSLPIASYKKVAYQLFQKLVSPLGLKPGESLLVIPDGILSHLPFAALLEDRHQSENYKHLPYLIKEHPISYAYSLSLLKDADNFASSANHQKPFLGVAPVYENSNRFAFLNHSEDEVKRISKKLGGDRLVGDIATKQKFMEIANQYQLIHLSSHAQALDSLSIYSWISFTDSQLPDENDHKLYLSEIYALSVPAKLIILGACETGSGQLSNGEGVMSLARGFINAGCQSVITTLWPVSNNATNQIMNSFYDHLMQGIPKNIALHKAQLEYLNDETTDGLGAHPFFWAPYIPIGDNSPINLRREETNRRITLAAVILLVLVFLGWRGRQLLHYRSIGYT